MSWYYIYQTSDGKLKSETDVLPVGLGTGLDFVTLTNRVDSSVMWDEGTHAFIARPAKVLIDRLQDLLDIPSFADAYNALSAARKTAVRNGLIQLLGKRRFRNQADTPEIND